MAEHLKVINDDDPLQNLGLVMTETTHEIMRSLNHIRHQPGALTMIAAVPGAGKSETILRYAQKNSGTVLISVAAGEGKIWDLAGSIADALEIAGPNSRRMRDERRRIGEAIGAERTLIIDEAQYLAYKNPRCGLILETLEWLRAMAEDSCFSLVYCGDLALLDAVGKLPQLQRRMKRPVIVRTIPKADVAAICEARGGVDPAALDLLYRVARMFGGLGDVDNVLKHARLFAGGASPKLEHVAAAIEDLKMTTKGGRI